MFFYEYIRNKPFNNQAAIFVINFLIKFSRFFIYGKKKDAKNIVIVALHRLGDSVFTIPAIKQIIRYHKENIFLVCYSETVAIYKIVIDALSFVELTHDHFFTNDQIAKSEARKILRRLNPSIVYDMTGNVTSASLIFNIAAGEIIGINEPYYRSIYTKYKQLRLEPHITDNYLDGIRSVIPFTDMEEVPIQNNKFREYILIHPFASKRSKEWGLNRFIELAAILNKKYKCVLVSPPNLISEDVKVEMQIKNIDLLETKSTIELINAIGKCLFLIGNDSGAVHIANLLGKPTFCIYGPTNPEYHKPLSGINEYVMKQLMCSSKPNEKICFTFGGVFCPSNECMQNLSFEIVKEKVSNFLDRLI